MYAGPPRNAQELFFWGYHLRVSSSNWRQYFVVGAHGYIQPYTSDNKGFIIPSFCRFWSGRRPGILQQAFVCLCIPRWLDLLPAPQHQHDPTVEEQYRRDFCLNTAGLRLKVDFLDTSGSHQFPAMRDLALQQGGHKTNLDGNFSSSEEKNILG